MNKKRHFLMKITTLLSVLIFGAMVFSSGCKKDDVDQAAVDDQIIQDYLEENNLEATKDSSGIYYIITTAGFGVHPTLTSIVEVNYKGYLTNDTIFDDTEGTPVTFSMYNLIEGWQICIPRLKEGGEGIFFIPSTLGYGGQQVGNIPKNSVLIFEIELLDVL